jgi:hypothetical protein
MIHKPGLERLEESLPDHVSLFEALVEEAEEMGTEVGQVAIPFVEEDDEFVVGTWVPELWLVVRKVLPEGEGE